MTFLVIHDNRHVSGLSIPKLCQALTNRGLNVPDREYAVYTVHNAEKVATIRYNDKIDCWMKKEYEFRPIKATHGLKPNNPEVRE